MKTITVRAAMKDTNSSFHFSHEQDKERMQSTRHFYERVMGIHTFIFPGIEEHKKMDPKIA